MLAHAAVTSIDQQARLDAKLRRELGEVVLQALSDERTEDIVLNPDSRLWVKRQGECFECFGILTGQRDPMNRLRRRGNFLELVHGLSHAEIIRLAVGDKKNILVVGS